MPRRDVDGCMRAWAGGFAGLDVAGLVGPDAGSGVCLCAMPGNKCS